MEYSILFLIGIGLASWLKGKAENYPVQHVDRSRFKLPADVRELLRRPDGDLR